MRFRLGGLVVVLALPCLVGWSFFDPFHKNVQEGNEKAKKGAGDEALRHYGEAARLNPGSPIPDFNRGVVLSNEGDAEQAGQAFLGAAAAEDAQIAADALYNLGNVMLEAQQFEPAIEAYLKSLDLDPEDPDARRNLEIALRRLQQQQQEQQQQPQDQDQEPSDEQEEQEDQQQPEPPEEPEDPEEDSRDEPAPEEPEDEQPPEQPQPQEQKMSREDAERLLNAVQSDELKVLEQLQDEQEKAKGAVVNDW